MNTIGSPTPIMEATMMAENKVMVNEAILRATNGPAALAAASGEQIERTVADWKQVELHPSLERVHNQRRASLLVEAERVEQAESPRRPNGVVVANMANIVSNIDQLGARRCASVGMEHEQVARVQQHVFANEVGTELRRAVASKEADIAMEIERVQRISKHIMATEVSTELERAVAGMAADKAMDLEQTDLVESPRRPTEEVVAAMCELVQSVEAVGNRKASHLAAKHEQLMLVQQHVMTVEVGDELRRTVATKQADAAVTLEQAQRCAQHYMAAEVNTELRRAVAGKQASAAVAMEQTEQLAEPRRPSGVVVANMSRLVTAVDQWGSQRRASVDVEIEQAQRIVQHLMSSEVGHELRRKVAAGEADAAMALEQAQRATQHYIETEVNHELLRTVGAQQAMAAAAAEQSDQLLAPRRPNSVVVANMANIVQSVDAIGRRRQASVEMDHEQVARIQQHIMSSEVGHELRRKVAAGEADAAMALEQAQRVMRHWVETEVTTQLRRAVSAKLADADTAREHLQQIVQPRRPSNSIRDAKAAVNAAIDTYNVPTGFVMVNPENDSHSG